MENIIQEQKRQLDIMYDITNLMTTAQIDSGILPTFAEASNLIIIDRLNTLIELIKAQSK